MRFVIVASPRTGSSHLTDLLNHQPDILCNGEIYHPLRVFVKWPRDKMEKRTRKTLRELRTQDPIAFKEYIFSNNFGRAHLGFKILNHQNNDVLQIVLDDSSIFKIILFRRNILANYSSGRIA